MRNFLGILVLALVVVAAPAGTEIYRWTDPEGQIHFTQDLSQVPSGHREEAVRRTLERAEGGRVSTFTARDRGAAPAAPSPSRPSPGDARNAFRIRVERAGTTMLVGARINNGLLVPFVVDTGATDVSIPEWAAERLGLESGGRTREYMTANGTIVEQVVMLDSVDLGGARVEDVPASISKTMRVGLLGLSFFNHFTYHVDAANGILTLVPNDLQENGKIRGGRSEAQWRGEYRGLRHRLERAERTLQVTNPNQSKKVRDLEDELAALLEQMEILDAEADQARVPMAWRE